VPAEGLSSASDSYPGTGVVLDGCFRAIPTLPGLMQQFDLSNSSDSRKASATAEAFFV
jgi:hypothetical protein